MRSWKQKWSCIPYISAHLYKLYNNTNIYRLYAELVPGNQELSTNHRFNQSGEGEGKLGWPQNTGNLDWSEFLQEQVGLEKSLFESRWDWSGFVGEWVGLVTRVCRSKRD